MDREKLPDGQINNKETSITAGDPSIMCITISLGDSKITQTAEKIVIEANAIKIK